jgi:hypothetical protein
LRLELAALSNKNDGKLVRAAALEDGLDLRGRARGGGGRNLDTFA